MKKKQRKLSLASLRRTPKEPKKRLDQDTEELPKAGRESSKRARNNQLGVG